jgi:hypothetical protein
MAAQDWTWDQDVAMQHIKKAAGLDGGIGGLSWQVLGLSSPCQVWTGGKKLRTSGSKKHSRCTLPQQDSCCKPRTTGVRPSGQAALNPVPMGHLQWPSGVACLSSTLPGRSVQDIRAVFDEIDENQDGKLTESELVAFAAKRGLPTTYVKEFLEAAGVAHAVDLQGVLEGVVQKLREPLRLRWPGVQRQGDGKGERRSPTEFEATRNLLLESNVNQGLRSVLALQ